MDPRKLPLMIALALSATVLAACGEAPAPAASTPTAAPPTMAERYCSVDRVMSEPVTEVPMEEGMSEDSWFPDNEILIADLDLSGPLPRITSDPVNLTQRPGYDNQPAFFADGSGFLYASIREDDQSDPYCYDLASGHTTRVLATPASEYSPTPMADGRFSAVRLDSEGSQQFWAWDPITGQGTELLPGVTRIGYFTWLDDHRIAMFVVEEPYSIYLADISTGAIEKVLENVGRGLKRQPDGTLVGYIDASEVGYDERDMPTGDAWFASYDPATGTSERLFATPDPRFQDFAWTPGGGVLIGAASTEDGHGRIMYWHPTAAPELIEVAQLPLIPDVAHPVVTRMAVSPTGDRIAIVVLTNPPE